MSELDEAAVEAAMIVFSDAVRAAQDPFAPVPYPAERVVREVVSAYLAAAARPTPDAEAMEQTFLDAVNAHTTEVIMSTKRGVISSDAEIAAFHRVMNLYRKAVTS